MKAAEIKTKRMEDLNRGEIWSINPKAKKFVLSNIDPLGLINSSEYGGNNGVGMQYVDYKDADVYVWGEVAEAPTQDKIEIWQRVAQSGADGMKGIVVDVNDTKFPDVDICILWDSPMHSRWITEEHPDELMVLNEALTDEQTERAKEARSLVKDLQGQHDKKYEDKTREIVKQELGQGMTPQPQMPPQQQNQGIPQAQARAIHAAVQKTVKDTMNAYAQDFRYMVEAGMLALTANEDGGEIDQIPEIIDSHIENIHVKVASVTDNNDVKIPATMAITQALSNTMLKQYFLTRYAFIRRQGNRWKVINAKNEQLGIHPNRKLAAKQLRNVEYRHRKNLD